MIPAGLSPPTMSPYSLSYGGLVFGAWTGTPYGQAYQLGPNGFTGLDLPAMRSGDVDLPRRHGQLIGLDLLSGRDITMDLIVGATAAATQQANSRALAHALALSGAIEQPLWIAMPDGTYGCMARMRKRTFNVNQASILTNANVYSLLFHCTDPRLYSAPTTNLAGLTPGTLTITNAGNIDCQPLYTFNGPMTNPQITVNGATLEFVNPTQGSTSTLAGGDVLVVDTAYQSVRYKPSGSSTFSDVRNWLLPGSQWATLAPGSTTITWSYFIGSGTLAIAYANAYDSL